MAEPSILDILQKPVPETEAGVLPQLWRWTLFIALPFTLYFLYRDFGLYFQYEPLDRLHFRPDVLAWRVFCVVQILHKLPITRPYPFRGWRARVDLAGLGLGLLGALLVPIFPTPGPASLWWVGLALISIWGIFQLWLAAFPPHAGRLRGAPGRRLYAAFAIGLIPNVPFVFAFFMLAASPS